MHSDPDHNLLLRTVGAEPGGEGEHSLFIKKHFKASSFGGTYEDYTMVQPAFVVVDRKGLCNIVVQGDTEEIGKPPVELGPTLQAGGGPLL